MVAQARWNSSSVSLTSRTKAWRWRTMADITSRKRGSGARSISASTAGVTSSWVRMIIRASPRQGQCRPSGDIGATSGRFGRHLNFLEIGAHWRTTKCKHCPMGGRSRVHSEPADRCQAGAAHECPRGDGEPQRRGRQAQHLAAHPGQRAGAAAVVPRHRHRGERHACRRAGRRQPDQGGAASLALARDRPLSRPHRRDRQELRTCRRSNSPNASSSC